MFLTLQIIESFFLLLNALNCQKLMQEELFKFFTVTFTGKINWNLFKHQNLFYKKSQLVCGAKVWFLELLSFLSKTFPGILLIILVGKTFIQFTKCVLFYALVFDLYVANHGHAGNLCGHFLVCADFVLRLSCQVLLLGAKSKTWCESCVFSHTIVEPDRSFVK